MLLGDWVCVWWGGALVDPSSVPGPGGIHIGLLSGVEQIKGVGLRAKGGAVVGLLPGSSHQPFASKQTKQVPRP